jgi:competence protein ComEC
VKGWLLPLIAGGFWAGVLFEPPLVEVAPWGLWVAAGVVILAGVTLYSPGPRRGPDPLIVAGLAQADEGPIVALDPIPAAPRAPPWTTPAMVLAFMVLGAGWAGLRSERVNGSYLARVTGAQVTVEGSLRGDPEEGSFGWSVLASVSDVRSETTSVRLNELLWIEGSGRIPAGSRDDRFEASGTVSRPTDPGFSAYLARQGTSVVLQVHEFRRVGGSGNPLVRATQIVRRTLLARVEAIFPAREGGLLMGLALGDTSHLDPTDSEHFRATGLTHLLAVSGENVAMVLAPMLGLAMLLGLSVRGRFVMGVSTVVFFAVLTGGEPSVLRAGVMAVLALLGVLSGRPRSTASILGAAILILLVADPSLVSDIGFQLSVGATAGIVALASPIAARLGFLPKWLALATATTVAAQAGCSPLLLYHFHQVPEVTILANLLAFAAVAPALLLGLAAAGASVVLEPVGILLAKLAFLPIRYLEGVADHLASSPIPSITSEGGWSVLLLGFAIVVALAVWLRSGRRVPRALVLGVVAAMPLFVWATALRAGPPSGLVVRFLDVGQGDAALVQSPGGATVLIDGGPDPQLVATKLAAIGVKRLDLIVATHPHYDHYVGLPAVLARFPTRLVADTGCDPPEAHTSAYRDLLLAMHQEGVPQEHPVRGDVLVVGDLRFDVLSPDRCWHGTNSDPNNDSLVLLLTYGGDSVLFANEPEADAQQVMLDDHEPLTAEVLNVPHHGAGTSIFPFFQAVHETIAIVSVGPNSYGHPVPETLDELRTTGARVFRTDRSGDVTIRFEEPGIRVDTGRDREIVFRR